MKCFLLWAFYHFFMFGLTYSVGHVGKVPYSPVQRGSCICQVAVLVLPL